MIPSWEVSRLSIFDRTVVPLQVTKGHAHIPLMCAGGRLRGRRRIEQERPAAPPGMKALGYPDEVRRVFARTFSFAIIPCSV